VVVRGRKGRREKKDRYGWEKIKKTKMKTKKMEKYDEKKK